MQMMFLSVSLDYVTAPPPHPTCVGGAERTSTDGKYRHKSWDVSPEYFRWED